MAKHNTTEVLVCVLKSGKDRDILLKGSYRIPLPHAPGTFPGYLAFYQPAVFKKSGKQIELYGKVKGRAIKKRIELLPDEPAHPDAHKKYVNFILGGIRRLKRPVKNKSGMRISFGFTSLAKLKKASDLCDIFDVFPMEDFLAKYFQKNNIPFYRQYTVGIKGGRRFRLDFALPSGKKWTDVECDAEAWHSRKRQRIKDSARDRILSRLGWRVLRLSENDLLNNTGVILKKISSYF